MMRVITGIAKGIRLETMEGLDVRPTTDKVKEAIFSSIQFELYNSDVLVYLPAAASWELKR